MPTDPKDNKGGDLAEITDLVNKRPKGTVTRRRNDPRAKVAREEIEKTRLINSSRQTFEVRTLRNKANAWAAQEKADIDSGKKKIPLNSKEKAMADNKPLKTALVRETETKSSRSDLANDFREVRKAKLAISPESSQLHRMQSAAETGEAQAFVGKMKPGVEGRTQQHHLQSREFPKTKDGSIFGEGRKDLGRSVMSTIRREENFSDGGSLKKLAKKRVAEGRSVAGPDAPSVPKNRSILKRGGKGARGGGGAAGGAPDFVAEDFGSHSSSSQNKAWDATVADIKKNLRID